MTLRCMLYKKALKKCIMRDKEFTTGEIMNMNTTDIHKVTMLAKTGTDILLLPLEIIVGFCLLTSFTGLAILPTTGVVIICAFVIRMITIISVKLQKRIQSEGDTLLKIIVATYNNIRFVKTEALENFFLEKIMNSKIRRTITFLKKRFIDQSFRIITMSFSTCLLVTLFGFYT